MAEEKTYAISVYYVDYPMGRSPEYSVSGGHTLEEAERIVEEKLCEVDKDPEKFACANPVFTIKEQEPREEDEEESLVKTNLVLHLDVIGILQRITSSISINQIIQYRNVK